MAKRTDLTKIVVIGSGPIVIGQSAEFDYAGTQACLSLKEEGYEVILINSNPASIMTDKGIADRVYIEPLTLEFISKILRKERPDALIPTLGGRTSLNATMELADSGLLDELGIELLGTKLQAIKQTEHPDLFKKLMKELNEPILESVIVKTVQEAVLFSEKVVFPLVVMSMSNKVGSVKVSCRNIEELETAVSKSLMRSSINQCLIEMNVAGYKEVEYEVIRDKKNQAMVSCNLEHLDPVGIHTGDSIVFAPSQTLTDKQHQILRDAALTIICALKIEGSCTIRFALDPLTLEYFILGVNQCVNRSTAIASKATGYPIARVATKLAVGLTIDEIKNPGTTKFISEFEPAMDYIVSKIPHWPFDKFEKGDRGLGLQMKSTGETMSFGRTLEESLLKAVRSLEIGVSHVFLEETAFATDEEVFQKVSHAQDNRLFYLAEIIRRDYPIEKLALETNIDLFFLDKLAHIIEIEKELRNHYFDQDKLAYAKSFGFSDEFVALLWETTASKIVAFRYEHNVIPVYKKLGPYSQDLEAKVAGFYSTYEEENESFVTSKESVLVLGSGPTRIGQGIEFDHAVFHSIKAIQKAGYEAIIINNNPETVSTDFLISDKLYFEPLTLEDVMHVIRLENPIGVMIQFGGQAAFKLAESLNQLGVSLLGTTVSDIIHSQSPISFEEALNDSGIPKSISAIVTNKKDALSNANQIGYPVLIRPVSKFNEKKLEIIENQLDLKKYMTRSLNHSPYSALLISQYINGIEIEVNAISDGKTILIPGIVEYIERSGIHSGDSMAVYPPQSLKLETKRIIIQYTKQLAQHLSCIGLINCQFVVLEDQVYISKVHFHASRTAPFLSKVTGIPIAEVATNVILGQSLKSQGYQTELTIESKLVHVKAPVFSFAQLQKVDALLGPVMKSTGEVMGSDRTLEKALYKAFEASSLHLADYGTVLLTLTDKDKEESYSIAQRFHQIGYQIIATSGTEKFLANKKIPVQTIAKLDETRSENILDVIAKGKVQLVINTTGRTKKDVKDGELIRKSTIEHGIPLLTSLDTAAAILSVLEARTFMTQSL
ncbi:carbamoyl-phosphate synthase large subunit [Carnobacterium funditum]|uniref:carbamoyl-phosphate synthase large subunit n=1 Tax=Carnobacterium funditum TaxID=2752 RepID=UPI0005515F9C|nr:carbamoyl-phosphate synthase large subunit [Carnobacterium funditum]